MEWHEITKDTIHNDKSIKGFQGEYSWLSNFYECPVEYEGLTYGSSEAAYQAAKTYDEDLREQFTHMSPREAKKVGKSGIDIRSDWDEDRFWVMHAIVTNKFRQKEHLKQKLLETGDKYLEETNWWGDTYWGVCDGIGENQLGAVLMMVRDEIRNQDYYDNL